MVVSILSLMFVSALAVSPAVHATGYTVDQTWCTGEGGTWIVTPPACFSPPLTVNSGDSLDVPSGVSLIASVVNDGAITIEGNLEAASVSNYGTITQTSGNIEIGTTFTNHGSVSISGSAYFTVDLGGTFINYGSFSDTGTFHLDGTFYEECGATFVSTPNTGVGTYYPPTGCITSSVPEFPLGLTILFALMFPALLVLRKLTFAARTRAH
jgi:hypothetical protein